MFAASFGLSENPFKITPNLRFVYLGENFRKVRGEALRALRSRNGAVLLTARAGVGKSILLRLLAQDLGGTDAADRILSLSCSPGSTVDQLVRQIPDDLDAGSGESEASGGGPGSAGSGPAGPAEDHLQRLVAECIAEGRACVLLIDEAQNLSDHELGRLFLLIDQVDHRRGRLRMALAGPPELENRLNQALPNDFRRRIVLRRRLEPLPEREVAAFVTERLEAAGAPRDDLFSADAIARIAHYAEGVPRLVNNLCQTALFLAEFESRDAVTADLVDEAARQIGVAPPESSKAVILAPRRRLATLARSAGKAKSSAKADRPPLLARFERVEATANEPVDADHIVLQPDFVPDSHTPRSKFARSRSWPGLLFGATATAALFATVFVLVEKPEILFGTADRSPAPPITAAGQIPATAPEPVTAEKAEEAGSETDATSALATNGAAAGATGDRPPPAEPPETAAGMAPAPTPDQEAVFPLPPAPPVDPAALAELGAVPDEAADETAGKDAAARHGAAPATKAGSAPEATPSGAPTPPIATATEGTPDPTPTPPPGTADPARGESVAAAPSADRDSSATAAAPAVGNDDTAGARTSMAGAEGAAGDGTAEPDAGTADPGPERTASAPPEARVPEGQETAKGSTPSSTPAPAVEKERVPDAKPAEPVVAANAEPQESAAESAAAGGETAESGASDESEKQTPAGTDGAPESTAVADTGDGDAEAAPAPDRQQASSESPAAAAGSPEPAAESAEVQNLLERAREQIDDLKLTTPEGDNAFETYQRVLALAPGHEGALQGFRDIADKYVQLAETAASRGRADRAEEYYEKAATIVPGHPVAVAALSRRQAEAAAPPTEAPATVARPVAPAEPQAPVEQRQTAASESAAAPATAPERPSEPPREKALDRLLAQVFGNDATDPAKRPVAALAAPPTPEAAPGPEQDGTGPEPAPAQFPMPPGALQTPERLEAALAAGANVNTRFDDGQTPLIVAAAQRRSDIVELLLARGAEPNAATEALGTPLMYAVWNGDLASVEALLEGGAAVDMKNIDGKTALMAAAANGHAAVVEMLLRHGADVNEQTITGWTALMYAVWGRHAAVVAELLEHGADVSIVNDDGDSAASIAAERGHYEIANMLRSQQARNE